MYKVYITKREYVEEIDNEMISDYISVEAVKPYDVTDDEWNCIEQIVCELAKGEKHSCKDVDGPGCRFDLNCIINDEDWDILAESEHYYIKGEYEDASLFRKSDSKRIASVGDFYGDPMDAYIDPEERFCITIGCGIIKYNLVEPFEGYMYDRDTDQWVEVGREPDNIEWCDVIEEVTDSYIIVSCEGTDRRRFNLETLQKEEM